MRFFLAGVQYFAVGIPYQFDGVSYMKFRIPEQSDLKTIHELLELSFSRIYAHFAKRSFSTLSQSVAAVEGAEIIGVINYRVFELKEVKIGYLYYLAVHPDHRRKGVGKSLILQAIDSIRAEIGPSEIYAAVEKKNKPSKELIKQTGFVSIKKPVIQEKFGNEQKKLFHQMNFMPWEELFYIDKK